MPSNNQTTFGASVIQSDEKNSMLPPPGFESPSLSPAISRDSNSFQEDKPLPPHSPFYQHPPASHERVQSIHHTPAKLAPSNSEKDLEYGNVTPYSHLTDEENPFSNKIAVGASNPECTMWPTHQTLKQTRMADKKQRRQGRTCGCGVVRDHWAECTKKQRLAIRIFIALLVCGAIVGVAVGITRSVNGGVWSGKGSSHDFNNGMGDNA